MGASGRHGGVFDLKLSRAAWALYIHIYICICIFIHIDIHIYRGRLALFSKVLHKSRMDRKMENGTWIIPEFAGPAVVGRQNPKV